MWEPPLCIHSRNPSEMSPKQLRAEYPISAVDQLKLVPTYFRDIQLNALGCLDSGDGPWSVFGKHPSLSAHEPFVRAWLDIIDCTDDTFSLLLPSRLRTDAQSHIFSCRGLPLAEHYLRWLTASCQLTIPTLLMMHSLWEISG